MREKLTFMARARWYNAATTSRRALVAVCRSPSFEMAAGPMVYNRLPWLSEVQHVVADMARAGIIV